MAKYFLDSSAFTKRYKREIGTDFVNSLFDGTHQLFYLNIAIIEVRKVFYRLRDYPQKIEGDIQITAGEFGRIQNQFAADLQKMQRVVLTEEIIDNTEMILQSAWLRSAFDLAHLSAFLISMQEHSDMIFISADNQLIATAGQFVLEAKAINPENF